MLYLQQEVYPILQKPRFLPEFDTPEKLDPYGELGSEMGGLVMREIVDFVRLVAYVVSYPIRLLIWRIRVRRNP